MSVIDFRTFNPELFVIPELQKSDARAGYASSTPTYNGKPVRFQSTLVSFPFALSYPNPERSITKHTMPAGLTEDRPEIQGKFFGFHDTVDDILLAHAQKNWKQFFATEKMADSALGIMNRTLKVDQDPIKAAKYGPSIRPTVYPTDETATDFQVVCTAPDGTPMAIQDVGKHSQGYIVYELTSVYSVNKKAFGYTLVLRTIKITKNGRVDETPVDLNMFGDYEVVDEGAVFAAIDAAQEESSKKREREEELEPLVPEEEEEESDAKKPKKKAGGKKK